MNRVVLCRNDVVSRANNLQHLLATEEIYCESSDIVEYTQGHFKNLGLKSPQSNPIVSPPRR